MARAQALHPHRPPAQVTGYGSVGCRRMPPLGRPGGGIRIIACQNTRRRGVWRHPIMAASGWQRAEGLRMWRERPLGLMRQEAGRRRRDGTATMLHRGGPDRINVTSLRLCPASGVARVGLHWLMGGMWSVVCTIG